MGNDTAIFQMKKKKSKRCKHNFIFCRDDYEYNIYFDKEPKAAKEELHDFLPLEGNEGKYYSVPHPYLYGKVIKKKWND